MTWFFLVPLGTTITTTETYGMRYSVEFPSNLGIASFFLPAGARLRNPCQRRITLMILDPLVEPVAFLYPAPGHHERFSGMITIRHLAHLVPPMHWTNMASMCVADLPSPRFDNIHCFHRNKVSKS